MPLIDLQTNLKSLKYGRDQRGGGDSNQPYIKRDIPDSDLTFRQQLDGDLPARSGPDFLLRNGFLAPVDAARDVSRLTQMFFDFKSPRGPLFIAKQNLLSRTSVKTEASKGIGYGAGTVNQGIYTPLNTIAQAGVGFTGTHLNLLGIDPTTPMTGVIEGGLNLFGGSGLIGYEDVMKTNQQEGSINATTFDMVKSRIVNNPNFQYSLNMYSGGNTPPPMFIIENYTETITTGGWQNRLVKTWFDKQMQGNTDNIILEYGGGPGSILGIGKTKIPFADVRTGINNKYYSTNKNHFFGSMPPLYRHRDELKKAGIMPGEEGAEVANKIGASFIASTTDNAEENGILPADREILKASLDPGLIYNDIKPQSTFKNPKIVKNNQGFFIPKEGGGFNHDFSVFKYVKPLLDPITILAGGAPGGVPTGGVSETFFALKNIDLLSDINGEYQFANEPQINLQAWQPSVYSDNTSLTPKTNLRTYLVGNQRESLQFIDFGGDISGSTLVNAENDGGLGVVPYVHGASAYYSVLASGSYDKTNNFNRIDYETNVRTDTYNFNVYTQDGNIGSFAPTPLQRANGSVTMTQDQLIAQEPVSQGGLIQDFRKTLIDEEGITTSTIMSTAPDYIKKAKETRVNLGNPGTKKDVFDYTVGNSILDKINASEIYSGTIAEHDGVGNDLAKFSIGILKNDGSGEGRFMNFRAFIDEFSDSYSAKWDTVNYNGRGEEFFNYNGFTREISMGWTVFAQSHDELIPMYKKLNYLASSLAPSYSSAGFMRGNLARLTVGGYLFNQLGIIKSITYTVPEESPWEIAITDEGKYDSNVKELPHMIKVSGFSFIPIQSFVPQKALFDKKTNAQTARYIALNNGTNNNYDS
jgi:hypothetical protein